MEFEYHTVIQFYFFETLHFIYPIKKIQILFNAVVAVYKKQS